MKFTRLLPSCTLLILAYLQGFQIAHAQFENETQKTKQKNNQKCLPKTTPVQTSHFGAEKSRLNRKTHITELRGNAYLERDKESVRADEIDYNIETSKVTARGRVRYRYGEYFVKADSIEVDINTKTGTIYNGNITNGQFALRGSKIDQVGVDRYLVKDYDYTTCLDCPNSWEMVGSEADITVEGYAFIDDFIFKIKDGSFFWLPYMIVPVKSKRQSGLIFPRFGFNELYGFYYVQPYFWAINDWSDMTLGLGKYTKKGARFEWEGRYRLTQRSGGSANFYWTRDDFIPKLRYRYAGKMAITQELPWRFESKLRINEVSDSEYPVTYSDDIRGRYEPVLSSDFFISRSEPAVSTALSFRRIRNLLYFDHNNHPVSGFDPTTVQEFPRLVVNSNDKMIFGSKIAAGVEGRFNRFTRGSEPFDFIPQNSAQGKPRTALPSDQCDRFNPNCIIREANRFTLVPNLYTTWSPLPWLSVVPSLQYRSSFYNFNGVYDNLARSYLLGQAELSVQLQRNFDTDDPTVSYKHTIRPTLTYSIIPVVQQPEPSSHPFVKSVQDNARPGLYFDSEDIVPLGTSPNVESYFTPLGNSLTYGFVSQLFRREVPKEGLGLGSTPSVSRRFEVSARQTFDIRETKKAIDTGQRDKRVVLSPVFVNLLYGDTNLSANADYTYFPFLDRYEDPRLQDYRSPHRVNFGMRWTWEKAMKDGILWYERTFAASYSFSKLASRVSSLRSSLRYSLNDYIMPEVTYTLDLMSEPNQVLERRYAVVFQSPSRCWRLDTAFTKSVDQGYGFSFTFALNLTGAGFGSTTTP